jgi:hypothetical protein
VAAAGAKVPGAVTPPSGLHAAYGNFHPALSGDQHRGVQHPVLLGPDQLLPLDEQHPDIALVLYQQIGHRSAFGDFFDGHGAGTDAFVGKKVFDRRLLAVEQGKHRQRLVANGLAHTDTRESYRHDRPPEGKRDLRRIA